MKYKSYENSALEKTTGTNIELLSNRDIVSARNINRPIINILENQENNYTLIQTLLKTIYGNSNGIIPNTFESFSPECFEIGSFKNDTNKYYLRLPLGLALISNLVKEDYTNNNSNPFLKKGDYEYSDNVHTGDYLRDKQSSFVIENKPEINLFERQLANLIGLDLSDLTNDIRIYQENIPLTVKVAIIDDSGNPRYDSSGCPMYVEDENSNVVYLAKPGEGNLNIYYDEELAPVTSYKYKTTYKEITNKKTPELNDEIIKQTVRYRENLVVRKQENGLYTSDISKALVLKDASGNDKTRVGYYMNVIRSTAGDDEVLWLPNKQVNDHFDIYLPTPDISYENFKSNSIVVSMTYGENDIPLEYISFEQDKKETLTNSLFSNVLNFSNHFTAQKIQSKNQEGEPIHGVRIISTYPAGLYDNVKISISYCTKEISQDGNEITTPQIYFTDEITKNKIENQNIEAQKKQKYFNNIFELTNAFLGAFDTMASNSIEDIYNNMNLETIIPVSNLSQDLFVYADLDNDIRNSYSENYDKVARFFTSGENLTDTTKYVKLFEIHIEPNRVLPFNPVVTSVKSYLDPLDRRLISTKRAELNSLLSTTRTELQNYTHIKDADGNREIEIREKFEDPKDEQLRITSPITRIVDVKDTVANAEPNTNSWEDTGNGDTPNDFFEESYEVLDTTVSEDDPNFRKYIYNNDNENKGIIIDKNKGIRIFNFDTKETNGNYSYSSFKPIEIISKKGNINIFNSENTKGRINIANLKDATTNIVDIKGKTRVRSQNTDILAIKRIADVDDTSKDSNVIFQIGNSYSKDDKTNIESNNGNNAVLGEFSFRSGTTGTSADNIVEHNRYMFLKLQRINENLKSKEDVVFEARNSLSNANDNKFVISSSASFVPKLQNVYLGLPIRSRAYSFEEDIIPHTNGQDVDPQILSTIHKTVAGNGSVTYDGTSNEYTGNEGRWIGAFIKNGYFGRINLADRTEDIKNSDERNGVLRLGNSNIYDVSSIFINQTHRTLNFDNQISNKSENTLYSNYSNDISKDGLFFILNRRLGAIDNNITIDVNKEPVDAKNWCALAIRTNGTHVSKNAYVYRQLFVNVNKSNRNESTTEDNSSLVVEGQTVVHGELLIGKDVLTVDNTSEHTSSTTIIRDASDKYKLYNEEYFKKSASGILHQKDKDGNYVNPFKENWLYEFVNYGNSYFDKNITVKEGSVFTENTTLNKALTINNNNYADYKFNVKNSDNCPADDDRFVNSIVPDVHFSNDTKIPRNNTSLDVKSGLIKFGSDCEKDTDIDDRSDVLLYGSQWIRRRLEVGSDTNNTSVLRNTKMLYEDIFDKIDAKESPVLYIEGASQFTGNVVFGQKLVTSNGTEKGISYTAKSIANKKQSKKDSTYTKAIFWGRNTPATINPETKKTNWNSDFDFHGRTWFDNSVKIGILPSDVRRKDAYDDDEVENKKYQSKDYKNCNGNLEILGSNSPFALKVEGPVVFTDGQDSVQEAQTINQLAKQIKIIADDNYEDYEDKDSDSEHEISQIILNKDKESKASNMEISTTGALEVKGKKGVSLTSEVENINIKAESPGKQINLEVADGGASINSKYSGASTVNVIYSDGKKDFTRAKFTNSGLILDGTNSTKQEAKLELNEAGQINADATEYYFKTNSVTKFKSDKDNTYLQFKDDTSIIQLNKDEIKLKASDKDSEENTDANITLEKTKISSIVDKTSFTQEQENIILTVLSNQGQSTVKSTYNTINLVAGADETITTNKASSPTGTSMIKLESGDNSKIDISSKSLNVRANTITLVNSNTNIQGAENSNNINISNINMVSASNKGASVAFGNSKVLLKADKDFGLYSCSTNKDDFGSMVSDFGNSSDSELGDKINEHRSNRKTLISLSNNGSCINVGDHFSIYDGYCQIQSITKIASGNLEIGGFKVFIS